GRRAERLHEELVPVAARWAELAERSEPLKRYAIDAETKTLELLEKSLADKGRSVRDDAITRKLLAAASHDVGELLPQLEPRAEEIAAAAVEKLRVRGEREAADLRDTLERQRARVREELDKYEAGFDQLVLGFAEDDRRQ